METLTPPFGTAGTAGAGGAAAPGPVPTGTITVLHLLAPASRRGRQFILAATTVGGAVVPTGVVLFFKMGRHGPRALGTAPLVNGVASLRKAFPAGRHVLVARYAGDGSSLPSVSAALIVVVR